MSALRSERSFSASSSFVWLFVLAVSTRVIYSGIIQLTFFALMLACAWTAPSLRSSVLASLKKFFTRWEGKLALSLLLSATLTTLLASARSDEALGVFLWLNWLKIVMRGFALFGCAALLTLPLETLRRTFRLVALCLLAAMLLWTCMVVAEQLSPKISAPYSKYAYVYWLYSQVGMVVIFFPLLIAAFGNRGKGKGNGVSFLQASPSNIASTILWRCCVGGAVLLLLSVGVITERRILGVTVSVTLLTLLFACWLNHRFRLYGRHALPLLKVGIVLFVAFLLLYLYHNPVVYGAQSLLCDSCNILYLPSWLVDDARQMVWHETLLVWQAHPWLGRGIDNDLTFASSHPHSRFLQVLSGLGIVGFVLFVSLLALLFVKACRGWYRTGSLSALSLMFVHSVYWATGLFELEIWVAWHFCMYAGAIAMSLCLDRLAEEGAEG